MDVTVAPRTGGQWRKAGVAAVISIVTMPLTAIWFMVVGGAMVAVSAAVAAVKRSPALGAAGFVGLGLLVGPAVYVSLAALQ